MKDPAGIPKYAIVETERRFLVDPGRGPTLSPLPFRRITDLYVDNARLRVRKVEPSSDADVVYKLCKKYEPTSDATTPITNIYLTKVEFDMLSALPGRLLQKRRYAIASASLTWALDVFEGELHGLVLAEVEAGEGLALTLPPWVSREVTADPCFRGGSLCHKSAAELAARLKAMP